MKENGFCPPHVPVLGLCSVLEAGRAEMNLVCTFINPKEAGLLLQQSSTNKLQINKRHLGKQHFSKQEIGN